MENKNKRETFSTGLAVFFATLGSAVGLGNIWKFPYLLGSNGGGAFLLAYLLCVALVGIPIMACEFYIGRKSRKNAVGAFKELKAAKGFKTIGFMGVGSSVLIAFFYSCVAGWVYSYVFRALKGDFVGVTAATAKTKFMTTVVGPFPPLVWQFIILAVVSVILIAGVKNGIERITKTLMPVLFILIIICDIRALTLPGASQGLKFLFHVDFTQLTGPVILAALGLAFFKLSLGMGTMITYGSYFTQDNNMISTSIKVALADSLISILAGIAIFPAVFSFGMQPSQGAGLLFMTIPLVFSQIPFGSVLLVAFFLLTAIAATTAIMSVIQVPVAYLEEEKGIGKKKAVLLTTGTIMLVGILATLSADSSSVLGNIHIIGKRGFFDSFDYLSSNILLPIGGLITAIYIGYFVKKDDFKLELSNGGTLNNYAVLNVVHVFIKYVSPILLVIVFLNSIGVIPSLLKLLHL